MAEDIEGKDGIVLLSKLNDSAAAYLRRFEHCRAVFCTSNLECRKARLLDELKTMLWSSGVNLPDALVDRTFYAADRDNAGRITPQLFAEVLWDGGLRACDFATTSSNPDFDDELMKASARYVKYGILE